MAVRLYQYAMTALDTEQLNETFRLLTHPHRRFSVKCLQSQSRMVRIDALSKAIASWEDRTTDPSPVRDEIKISLHHAHLPMLENAGIVTYGENSNTVSLESTAGLGRFLDEVESVESYIHPAVED